MYAENITLITEIESIGVQLKPETYIKWSIALAYYKCPSGSDSDVAIDLFYHMTLNLP